MQQAYKNTSKAALVKALFLQKGVDFWLLIPYTIV